MLSLRAGLGPQPALSRTQVARRLQLGVARTGRLERHGLRRLDALGAAGSCGSGGTSDASLAVGSPAAAMPPAGAAGALADQASHPRSGVGGVSESGGGSGGGDVGSMLPPPIGHGGDATLLIVLLLAAMVALLVRRELRRH